MATTRSTNMSTRPSRDVRRLNWRLLLRESSTKLLGVKVTNNVVERKALQCMLEQTGGLQFIRFSLSTEKKRPVASSAMGTISTEDDQDAGWDFILEHGERDRSQFKQPCWIHLYINKDGSPIRCCLTSLCSEPWTV